MSVQTARGRRPIASARRRHAAVLAAPDRRRRRARYRGTNGQNTQRPSSTSRTGSSVVITANATTMPVAATGPMPRTSFVRAASRHSRPTATVAAEARIAGNDRRHATAIAAYRSRWRRSSSR